MTLNEWKQAVKNSKGVDYDGLYGRQCVDLVNDFANRVLGIKDCFYGLTYAYEIYTKYPSLTKINSNFTGVTFEDVDTMLVAGVNRTNSNGSENVSPMEQIMKY